MLCCLCLKESNDFTEIFDDNEENNQNIAKILSKHFWFEPLKDDPALSAICLECWRKLHDFHEFYEMVEHAHKRYKQPELITVKTEEYLNKDEPIGELEEFMMEVPIPFSGDLESLNKTTPAPDTNNENSCDSDKFDIFPNDSDPFDDSSNDSPSKQDLSQATTETNENSKNTAIGNDQTSKDIKIPEKRKRGRKPKNKDESRGEESENKTRKSKAKAKTSCKTEEESAYKIKMKSFDEEIAQYMGIHCDVCNIAVDNFAGVKNHMRTVHNIENGYVKCCDKMFYKRANLLHHIRHHVDPNCYRCDECNQIFSDYQSLRNHNFIKHQKEEDKIYACNECPKKFAKKYLLEQHRTFKHKDRFKQCKTCNRRYKTLEELQEHNKEPCAGGRMCDICAKVIFGGPSNFIRHQMEHNGQAKVQCDLCGSWHKDKYALRKHKRRHMQPKTPHVCDICNKVSPSRDAMESHKKYAHRTPDKAFECEFCKKCFKRPRSLKEHLSTHTGEFLYTCPHCPKTFNSNANMHSHRKNVHPVEFEEARKRRKRVGYLGDQLQVAEAQKVVANNDTPDINSSAINDTPDINNSAISSVSQDKTNDITML
ncbi:transcription factor grauzone-like [Musca autumnalis]|uniref:transcription factor grauzone-like n=1 Tax=Musca autumnalis TaxID=221902 RepID=UPI003CF8883D